MLTLFNASTLQDSGVYSCVAENTAGLAQHSVRVSVTPALCKRLTHHTAPCFTSIHTPLCLLAAPEFVTRPVSQLVSEGDEVRLECEVQALPTANLTWLMHNQPLPTCTQDLLDMSVPCMSADMLVIQSFQEEHEGQYSCLATNEVGVSLSEVSLTLVPEEIGEITNNVRLHRH